MNRKKSAVALTIALAFLFSIISARMTIRRIATPENCVIHDLPENMPVLLNTSNGTVGELTLSPLGWMDWASPDNDSVALTAFFTYECDYPDFTVTSNSSSRYVTIKIPKNNLAKYDYRLAAQNICSDCLRSIEQNTPTGNFLFLVNGSGGLGVSCLNDAGQRFSIMDFSFFVTKAWSSDVEIKMHCMEERNGSQQGTRTS